MIYIYFKPWFLRENSNVLKVFNVWFSFTRVESTIKYNNKKVDSNHFNEVITNFILLHFESVTKMWHGITNYAFNITWIANIFPSSCSHSLGQAKERRELWQRSCFKAAVAGLSSSFHFYFNGSSSSTHGYRIDNRLNVSWIAADFEDMK